METTMRAVKSIKSYWDNKAGYGVISYLDENGSEIYSQGAASLEQIAAVQTLISSMPVWADFPDGKLYFGSQDVTKLKISSD